ncbi:hypothetical protein MKW92_011064 [Papaver armeniacum]|nr:hypothetical protein MKW92_018939 [Papaver armeniacum]KAI3880176.1 hypothetical protein MKW92_011064 [Papaver armeniacum]
MAFWGIELVAGKPTTHVFEKSRGRLRISKATLGIGLSEGRSVVQCKVGNRSPILLCSLRPRTKESCSMDIEFKEDEDVVFEVIGPTTTNVHLSGFYLAKSTHGEIRINDHSEYDEAEINGNVRTLASGLIIADLEKGQHPSTMIAIPGSKVSVSCIGQLKSNGYIFESILSNAPFYFRLGAGEVIAGWEIGINGMRVGDKRRITIPPLLAYGSKGRQHVPPNSWVIYEIKMLSISYSVPV